MSITSLVERSTYKGPSHYKMQTTSFMMRVLLYVTLGVNERMWQYVQQLLGSVDGGETTLLGLSCNKSEYTVSVIIPTGVSV